MKIILKIVGALSCGIFAWSSAEIIKDPQIQISVGNTVDNLGKVFFFLPYFMLIISVLKLISVWNDIGRTKTSFLSSIGIVALIIADLFYSSFVSLKDNIEYQEYDNGFISVTRKRSIEEKELFLNKLSSDLNINPENLKEWNNIDLNSCVSYKDILDRVSENITFTPSEIDKGPSLLFKISNNIIEGIGNHPYITLSIVALVVLGIYFYRSEINELVKNLGNSMLDMLSLHREHTANNLALAKNNEIMVEVYEMCTKNTVLNEKMINEMKHMIGYLLKVSNVISKLTIDHTETRNRVDESIVVLVKLIRNNPSLDSERILDSIYNSPALPIDLIPM